MNLHTNTVQPTSREVEKGSLGWTAREHYALPGGYRLTIVTFRGAHNALLTHARVEASAPAGGRARHAIDLAGGDNGDMYEQLEKSTPARLTRAVVERQHTQAVAAHLARLTDAARTRYRMHAGPGPELDAAVCTLVGDDEVHTLLSSICLAGASMPRAKVVAAMTQGFAFSDEYAHLGHPIVTVHEGHRLFLEARGTAQPVQPAAAGPAPGARN